MVFNKLSPGANLLWESSRMMLPEHRKQIQTQRRELNIHSKPLLDEQHQEQQTQMLNTAFQYQFVVEIEVFDPYKNQLLIGKIKTFNFNEQILYLQATSQLKSIHFSGILNVTYKEDLSDDYISTSL